MERFEDVQPKENEKDIPKDLNLGVERVQDPEKAFLMAKFENAARDKAAAYENHLNNPAGASDATGYEAVAFSMWKMRGYSPEDIIETGRIESEVMGRNYDIERKIQSLEQKGSRFGLHVQAIKGLASAAGGVLFTGAMAAKGYLTGENKNDTWKSLVKNVGYISSEALRASTAAEALRQGRKGGRTEHVEAKLWKQAQDSVDGAARFTAGEVVEDVDVELDEEPIISEKKGEGEVEDQPEPKNILDQFAQKMADEYRAYLATKKEERKQNKFFETLEGRGVKPEHMKKEAADTNAWIDALGRYKDKMRGLNDKELGVEAGAHIIASIIGLAATPKVRTGEAARDWAGILFKAFQAAREEERRKTNVKSNPAT